MASETPETKIVINKDSEPEEFLKFLKQRHVKESIIKILKENDFDDAQAFLAASEKDFREIGLQLGAIRVKLDQNSKIPLEKNLFCNFTEIALVE